RPDAGAADRFARAPGGLHRDPSPIGPARWFGALGRRGRANGQERSANVNRPGATARQQCGMHRKRQCGKIALRSFRSPSILQLEQYKPMSTSHVVIPARLASTRLPRKLLLAETGKPLIQHTYEAACRAQRPGGVAVAA